MKQIKCIKYTLLLSLISLFTACSQEFLDVKPQKQQVILKTLQDVGALLDNASIMNRTDYYRLISDGDFYYSDVKLTSSLELHRNLYLWAKEIDPTGYNNSHWDLPYQQIMYANIALETLKEMKNYGDNQVQWKNLYGSVLFYRAWAHYNLLQDFAAGYEPTHVEQLGVPIIEDSTYPKKVKRATLKEVYDFILNDLINAVELLPLKSEVKTRPSKQAVYALMARIYQNQHNFDQALIAVDKALAINDILLDYNELTFSTALPFSGFTFNTHPELIFFTSSNVPLVAVNGVTVVDELYRKYKIGDLRSKTFFNDSKLYIGTYSGNSQYHFTGLAVDELYLIKAESLARADRIAESVSVMQDLLKNRFLGNVVPVGIPNEKFRLTQWILDERQKELIGRSTRWTDLKRLNRSEGTQITLNRSYLNNTYSLLPNDSRYVFEIPLEEIKISELEQNHR